MRTECDERGLGLAVWTKEKLGNCQIRVVFRTKDARSNAGVIMRLDDGVLDWVGKDSPAVSREKEGKLSPEMIERMQEASEKEQGAWYAVHHGYEVQICDTGDAMHRTGAVYSLRGCRGSREGQAGEWRTMLITLDGDLVKVELDGKLLTTFDPASKDNPPRKIWHEPKREPQRPGGGLHRPADARSGRRRVVQRGERATLTNTWSGSRSSNVSQKLRKVRGAAALRGVPSGGGAGRGGRAADAWARGAFDCRLAIRCSSSGWKRLSCGPAGS